MKDQVLKKSLIQLISGSYSKVSALPLPFVVIFPSPSIKLTPGLIVLHGDFISGDGKKKYSIHPVKWLEGCLVIRKGIQSENHVKTDTGAQCSSWMHRFLPNCPTDASMEHGRKL